MLAAGAANPARRSRSALFAVVAPSLVTATLSACGARTDVGYARADAAVDEEDASAADAGTDSTPVAQCVDQGGFCTVSSECCSQMECLGDQCAYAVFYGAPFPRDE